MKQTIKKVATVASAIICTMLISPTFNVSASSPEEVSKRLVSTESVYLTSNNPLLRTAVSGYNELRTYENNGVTVFAFNVSDYELMDSARAYLLGRTGDPTFGGTPPMPRLPAIQVSDTVRDGAHAMAHGWMRNTHDPAGGGSAMHRLNGG